jgi:hypothetical protein
MLLVCVETDKGGRMKSIQNFSRFCREAIDAPTDAQGNLLGTFTMTLTALIDELTDMKETYDTIEVTLDDDDPTKVALKFHIRAKHQ